jgi:DNA invertase Pin-like site-specific DNA recombinase
MPAQRGKFVSYLRVSTNLQGRSGLGLEAQRAAVLKYVAGGRWEMVEEFVEVETGKLRARPELERALAACRMHRARLVVAKLDRLARDAEFLIRLQNEGADFVCADMPEANRLTVGILACVAEDETRRISERTKAALAAAKARGQKLGNPEHLDNRARAKGRKVSASIRSARATADALDRLPIIDGIRAGGPMSLRQIAAELKRRGVPTARGKSDWSAAQVSRILKRAEPTGM